LVLSHKGYFISGFPSQINPLSWCLTHDHSFLEGFSSFLEGFSQLLSLMDLGSRFPCKEGFLTRLNCVSCAQPESPNMMFYLFYFHGSAPVLWLNIILNIFFYFYYKTTKYHYNLQNSISQYLILYLKLRRLVLYINNIIWYMISINFKWKIYLFLTLIKLFWFY